MERKVRKKNHENTYTRGTGRGCMLLNYHIRSPIFVLKMILGLYQLQPRGAQMLQNGKKQTKQNIESKQNHNP